MVKKSSNVADNDHVLTSDQKSALIKEFCKRLKGFNQQYLNDVWYKACPPEKSVDEIGEGIFALAIDALLSSNTNCHTFVLTPLVPIIMEFHLSNQGRIFKNRAPMHRNYTLGEDYQRDVEKSEYESLANQGDFGIARTLFKLNEKAESLSAKGETTAATIANELHRTLADAFKNYLSSNVTTHPYYPLRG